MPGGSGAAGDADAADFERAERADADAEPADAEFDEADAERAEASMVELAISSDGEVFVPDGHAVRVIPIGDPGELAAHREDIEAGLIALSSSERQGLVGRRAPAGAKPGYPLNAGDFSAARIRRGAAGVVPWHLETLGREGEFGWYAFETEDGARAALAMLEKRRIVQPPRDDEGRVVPPSAEQFEEARRRWEETERQLALDAERDPGLGDDEPPPPADWSSRR
jgi:hypothetical protein